MSKFSQESLQALEYAYLNETEVVGIDSNNYAISKIRVVAKGQHDLYILEFNGNTIKSEDSNFTEFFGTRSEGNLPRPFKPAIGEGYFCITPYGIVRDVRTSSSYDIYRTFRTKEDAMQWMKFIESFV